MVVTARWLENTVSINITSEVTPADALTLFSELDQQPTWSPWLKSCDIHDKDTGLSTWTVGALGLTYSWKAIASSWCESPHLHRICWESIDGNERSNLEITFDYNMFPLYTLCYLCLFYFIFIGLPNKGQAVFYVDQDSGENMMDLTVMYDLPGPAAYALEKLGSIGAKFIENTLRKDLIRFNKRLYSEAKLKKSKEAEAANVEIGTGPSEL